MAYDMAGVTEPRKQIHVAEPYDPFDYKELHHLEGLQLFDKGKAPEAARGRRDRPRRRPARAARPAGCSASGNPIAAAGLMKIAELFWQLRGEAGARQVPGTPERGVAQAWGDLMQVGTVVVMGARDGGGRGRYAPATTAPRAPPPLAPTRHRRCPTPSSARRRAPSRTRSTSRYEWDAGEAMGAFLEGLRDGRIVATYCASCERTLVPPRKFCERCFRPTDAWTEVRGHRASWRRSRSATCVGHAAAGSAGAPGGDPARRLERGRVPPHAGRGRARRRLDRDGGRGGLEAGATSAPARSWTSRTSGRATRACGRR